MKQIIINGRKQEIRGSSLTYERALELAGKPNDRVWTIVVSTRVGSTTLVPGGKAPISDRAIINIADTSGA